MTAELMVYALLAGALIFWLRSILGTRSEDDPHAPVARMELDTEGKVMTIGTPEGSSEDDRFTQIKEFTDNKEGNMEVENEAARDALIQIAKADREFNIVTFLRAAQDAFVFVVESFAEGDREMLADLLGPQVYDTFNGAITAREESEQTMRAEIQSVQTSSIIEARLEDMRAFVTIRFLAEEVSVTKDKDQNIIQGHPDKITQMRDVWTFFRDLKSNDPRWIVVETRDDGELDNDIIPNSE